jgi:hypothetical protein
VVYREHDRPRFPLPLWKRPNAVKDLKKRRASGQAVLRLNLDRRNSHSKFHCCVVTRSTDLTGYGGRCIVEELEPAKSLFKKDVDGYESDNSGLIARSM